MKQEVLLILNFYVTQCTKSVIEGEEYLPSLNIGYTMNPRGLRDLDTRGNLYKHPRAKRKGVYGFQGDLNPIGPEGSSCKVFIL